MALNLPLALADPSAWLAPYRAQSARLNDRSSNSVWHWLLHAAGRCRR